MLDDLGLHSALRWLAEDSRERLQLPVEVHLEHVEDTIRTQKQRRSLRNDISSALRKKVLPMQHATHIAQCVRLSLTQDQQRNYLTGTR